MGKGREASGFGGRVITMRAHAVPIKQVTPHATVGALEPRNCIPYSTTAKLFAFLPDRDIYPRFFMA